MNRSYDEYKGSMLPLELVRETKETAGKVLLSATDAEIPNRRTYIEIMNSADAAVKGDFSACCTIADMLFDNEQLLQLFHPGLIHQWRAYALFGVKEDNWTALRDLPGHSFDGVLDYCGMRWAEALGMIGDLQEKQNAVMQVRRYVDTYRGEDMVCTDRLIYLLLGMPASKAARKTGFSLTGMPVDRALAIVYYKQMINDEISKGRIGAAAEKAKEFEDLLGIKYFESALNDANSSTPKKKSSSKRHWWNPFA